MTSSLTDGVATLDLGSYRLPDVVRPQQIFQLGSDPFPPLRTESNKSGNLPRQLGRLIGRDDDLLHMEGAISSAPLITLIGPGGIGKTRLAIEAARRAAPGRPDGTWLVELASIVDARDFVRLVGDVLGVTETGERSLTEAVLRSLEKKDCVVVLDNCEHVIDTVSNLVKLVVDRCPDVSVIATSREGLGIHDELLVAVRPLSENGAALELFNERAVAVDQTFDVEANRGTVEELCRSLDGMQLAIELAAARVRTLSPRDLAQRLDERHRSLRTAIEWYADYMDQIGSMLHSPAEVEGVARANEVWDNLRVAHGWACAVEDLDLAVALIQPAAMELYWRARTELGDWMERILELPQTVSHPWHSGMVHIAPV